MKLINRSKSKLPINWKSSTINSKDIENTAFRYRDLIINNGTKAFNIINDELKLPNIKSFKVRAAEINKSENSVSDDLKKAILDSSNNIKLICEEERKNLSSSSIETTKGITLWKEFRSIETVGLYVPGGSAPLISSFLMQLIPAKVAGCKNIVVCTPPLKSGSIAPEILWIAKLFGIESIYKVGGAQAIFAMAYGTTVIPKVDKIFGPGNSYVNIAKKICSEDVAIDLPAGPSEVMVVSDDETKAGLVAADVLSQLEHDAASKAFVLSNNLNLLKKIKKEINIQLSSLSRKSILEKSLLNLQLIKTRSMVDSICMINECAPEHLILLDDDYSKFLSGIYNAGSIFCGSLSPESFGDYSSGSNHVLPTNGMAKVFSGLGVKDFGKQINVQTASSEGFLNLKDTVITLANAESLDAHARAVEIREKLDTGLKYLDHLLEQFSKHGSIDLNISCLGDLEIDEHHTIEDIAITLGSAINKALQERKGISRYASSEILVMDEVKCNVSIDLCTRRFLNFKCSDLRERVGDFPTEMFEHFFISLINSAAFTCHIDTIGSNSHHLLEATFKTFARCLRSAIVIESNQTSSTKGLM